jgi:hypothetical protein
MAAMDLYAFRFSRAEMLDLDWLVNHEKHKGAAPYVFPVVNRTSVIKWLIAQELIRIEEAKRVCEEQLHRAAKTKAKNPNAPQGRTAEQKERRRVMQKERRARKAPAATEHP